MKTMYKLNIYHFNDIYKQALSEGKNVMLVAKSSQFVYHQIQELVGYLNDIESAGEGEMAKLTITFAHNKKATTMAYVDNSIKTGEFISIIGFFVNDMLYCKGGINRVWTKPRDIGFMKFDTVYKMGIVPSLSELKPSRRFADYDLISNPQQIGTTGFYYLYDTQIKQVAENKKTAGIQTNSTHGGIDISKLTNIEEETEDIPDIEIMPSMPSVQNQATDNN